MRTSDEARNNSLQSRLLESKGKVLVVDDDIDFGESLVELLEAIGYEARHIDSESAALREMEREPADVALVDLKLGTANGVRLLPFLKRIHPPLLGVVITGHASVDAAIDALHEGAYDFLRKPFHSADLDATLKRCFDKISLERQAIESARILRESELRYRSLVENAPLWISELTPEGLLRSINHAGRAMLRGTSSKPGVGSSYLDFVSDGDVERVRQALQDARQGEASNFEFKSMSGETQRVWAAGLYPIGRESEVEKFLCITEDVTTRRLAEEALGRSEQQLQQAQKLEALGLLAGGVAHDFNNILTVITGYSQLLVQGGTSVSVEKAIDNISRAADRAASLTKQLLAFGRKQLLQSRVLSLNDVLAETEVLLRRSLGEDIELEGDYEKDLVHVVADPGQVEQVIVNLAINARDAMPSGGTLSLTTSTVDVLSAEKGQPPKGRYARISVRDNGSGMDEATLSRVFDPFFTTKGEAGRGTGLGLSMVYGIVKQSGGYIYASSKPDSGTRFDVFFPAVDAPKFRPEPAAAVTAAVQGGKVLLVEDDNAVRRLTHQSLVSRGYEVLTAESGEEALEMVEALGGKLDLILTDVVMPKMSGPALAAQVLNRFPAIRVLYISGYADDRLSSPKIDARADLLQKPFTPSSLAQKVGEVLGREIPE